MTVVRRGLEPLVPEQDLDHPDINPLLQQVGGKAVAQAVEVHGFVEPGNRGGGMKGPVELAGGEGVHGIPSRKQPAAPEHLAFCSGDAPPLSQQRKQRG